MLTTPEIDALLIEEQNPSDKFANEVLKDFWICCLSREVSLLGRKEVLTGKAKFGILGDGKEVPQVAMARAFQKGDHRAGYYRDQTFMFALGLLTVEEFFAQLYADSENDPFSAGRQMNAHFATPYIDEKGEWVKQKEQYNISSDISPTAGQMARSLGLAYASAKYRSNDQLQEQNFSQNGNEVCFCTIGDASTSEGVFFETINAATVIKAPLAISVWDDGYGISVPKELQTAKGSISKVLQGFGATEEEDGMYIFKAKAWDYPALVEMYEKGVALIREHHRPALFHVEEVTQPQGHSTSGSHERYKSEERLQWEIDFDCNEKMAQWIIESGIATQEKIDDIRAKAVQRAKEGKDAAWKAFQDQVAAVQSDFIAVAEPLYAKVSEGAAQAIQKELGSLMNPVRSEIVEIARKLRMELVKATGSSNETLDQFLSGEQSKADRYFHSHLYSSSDKSPLRQPIISPTYEEGAKSVPGYQILNQFFELSFERQPELYAFGEDVGKIGDVNQGFAGLQEKFGKERVFDTGIREWTIIGQAIGMAMRGLRPIAEIQYLDYLMYALSPLTDDLATLRYRSNGQQMAPAIIRTRGHRLEGIWHAGSHLGMILHALRGMHVLVPRNMTQAAGMYNTLLQSDDPALVIECLNGYRLREPMPSNLGAYTVPLGIPEILREGKDITLVTYGSCVRIAEEACERLATLGIEVELIDAQSLLPFDTESIIKASLEKTNRIVFMDEDVPGGATAYMMQEVLDRQKGYQLLDAQPICISAKAHRPPYGSDGDYFTKPNESDVVEAIYNLMGEASPDEFPHIF